jgi:hypothetical protein
VTLPRLRRLRSGIVALVRLRPLGTERSGGVPRRLLDQHPKLAEVVRLDLDRRAREVRRRAHEHAEAVGARSWHRRLAAELRRPVDDPDSLAAGRADLQLTWRPPADSHAGTGWPHLCRCDSWLLAPELRGAPHACACHDPDDTNAHLPPGGPPFIATPPHRGLDEDPPRRTHPEARP